MSAAKWKARNCEIDTSKDLIFQTLDWYCDDVTDDSGFNQYKIFVFGIDNNGIPVSLQINNFYPFFFVELHQNWDSTSIYSIKESFIANGIKNIKSIDFLERKKYYGFENNKLRKFLKLSFYSSKAMRSTRYRLEQTDFQINGIQWNFPLYESNIDPILRFTHLRDILTAGWVIVKSGQYFDNMELLECNSANVSQLTLPEYSNKLSDIRVLYFDIEACSDDGSFPNALNKNDRVTQICCIIKDSITQKVEKYLFNLGTCDEIESTVVLQFKTEKQLLLDYSKFMNETDPDIIVGYNIFGFDNGYLFERAKVLGIEEQFNYQSRLRTHRTEVVVKELNNQQSGFNKWKMTRLVGRLHIDLLQVIKKDFKLESYKLNNVGEHFLKEGKDDVSPKEIFEAWSKTEGTREKRTRVGKYCVQDTNLCLKLFEKFAVLPNHIEMAKVTRVPIEYLITRGQSIKVFSQIAYETRKTGYLIPLLERSAKDSKFQGATVLEAKTGYYQKPVAGLDFASLYPSIMIAHNMCYSTVILDKRYLNLSGVEYSTIDCGTEKFSFVQNQPGVLSGILESLWKNRKVTKKEMNASTDPFTKTVLNAKQLAIKVSMNSIYGFTGAVVGALPCLEISQSVTGCGRLMIEQTSNLAKNQFGCEIVYGDTDSCYVIFPEPVDPDGTLTTLFKKAEHAAKEISKTFKKPIELEFEKFMFPLLLVAKKRYMYVEWTDPQKHNGEIEAKGVELVRRDNCQYVKETLDSVITPIFFENNLPEGKLQAELHIDNLLNGKVDIKKLVLSKNLKNDYKKPETIAHFQLVEKMKIRDPNGAPKPGDRVPFVYVDIGDPKALSWKKVEDPEYVIQNNIPIDTLYYLEHQLKNPLKTIFDILLGELKCNEMFNRKSLADAKQREKVSIGDAKRKRDKIQDIRGFFKITVS
jgi:DNA polymerase delta subunit 1